MQPQHLSIQELSRLVASFVRANFGLTPECIKIEVRGARPITFPILECGCGPDPSPSPSPSIAADLTPLQAKIISYLGTLSEDKGATGDAIAHAVNYDRAAVISRGLTPLKARGLIRNDREKGGYSLTESGAEVLMSIPDDN